MFHGGANLGFGYFARVWNDGESALLKNRICRMSSRILGYKLSSGVLNGEVQDVLGRVKARIVSNLNRESCSISMFWNKAVAVNLFDRGFDVFPSNFLDGLRECHDLTSTKGVSSCKFAEHPLDFLRPTRLRI